MGSIVLLVRKQWNLDFSFLKGSSNAALPWEEGEFQRIYIEDSYLDLNVDSKKCQKSLSWIY